MFRAAVLFFFFFCQRSREVRRFFFLPNPIWWPQVERAEDMQDCHGYARTSSVRSAKAAYFA